VTDHPSTEVAMSAREVIELDHREAMRLLASVDYGRVVFNDKALPAIRVVNHVVDDGRVIVRTRLTATVSTVVRLSTDAGVVVADEADDLEAQRQVGWSVVLTGWAATITDPEQIARYERLLHPWVNMTMDTMIAIQPEIVTGIRIIDDTSTK
jgi:hypothetical protein